MQEPLWLYAAHLHPLMRQKLSPHFCLAQGKIWKYFTNTCIDFFIFSFQMKHLSQTKTENEIAQKERHNPKSA